ncbi:MAG: YlxR family protein [Rhodococcus sp.]|nr:YlxR family protein [Rhodococcus sp. (in: high G+C Gram-positive bacteria)]
MVQHELAASARVSTDHPVRTCVGCRQRAQTVDLLRIVVGEVTPDGAMLVPDPRRRLPGRGAWLHLERECLVLAERRRAFGRALRVSGKSDTSHVEQYLSRRTGTSNHEHTVKHQR